MALPLTTYPGVYIQELSDPSIFIANGATAVPVFIGGFSKADGSPLPAGECIAIQNWLDFTAQCSVPTPVKITIENREQENKRVATLDFYEPNSPMALRHYFENGGGPCYILPLNTLDAATLMQLSQTIAKEPAITLLVCPETDTTLGVGGRQQVYTALAPLLRGEKRRNYFLIADSQDGDKDVPETEAMYTAVYFPELIPRFTRMRPDDANVTVTGHSNADVTNLATLKSVDAVLYGMINNELRTQFSTPMTLPPSAAVAGIYCTTDSERGVWKAPANVALKGVSAVTSIVTDTQQGTMNEQGINVIRSFLDQGMVVFGARTRDIDPSATWRYIPVRRLFNAAERDIQRAIQFAVFETNNQPTWERVRAAIGHYLYGLWRKGGLQGNTAEEAYFVQIGKDITMTEDDIKNGKMIIKIGLAAVRPAEFIILQFTQQVGQD